MNADVVLYELRAGTATITLNRPDVANAVDLPTAQRLLEVVHQVETDEARCVLLTGAGTRFCAGGDVQAMAASADRGDYVRELAETLDRALRLLSELSVPVVAAVHGSVAGAGLGAVLSCDLVVAARSTRFLTAYAGVGLTPDCGVSYLLPRAIGQQRALAMALSGQVVQADEALAWGLVTQLADDGQHLESGRALAARLAGGPAHALGQAKRLLRTSWDGTRARSAVDEVRTIAEAVVTTEARSRIDGFVR